jgi:Ni/Fe-hydrogenase subunit HybB-like protein
MISRLRSSIWTTIFFLLMAAGAYSVFVRFAYGLGGATNLSDQFPWGLWIGFDVLCGVGLAAGGFTLVATVHIFNIEKYKPILRPAILTAFLGYLLVCAALMLDIGRPWRIWHPLVMWNHHSVMFEVAWCVTLYTTVLALEFAPVVFERLGWHASLKAIHAISVPLMILGVILSTLHQSSLGTLYLIFPEKMHPLWYSPMLPLFFFISSIAVGLAMTIFESWHSSRAFSRALELPLLQGMGRLLAVILSFYLVLRFVDLAQRGSLGYVIEGTIESWLFVLEIGLMALAALLLFQDRILRSPQALYGCSLLVVFGFVTNRMNVSITGLERTSGTHYIPRWTEVAVTLAIIAFGFAVFRLAVKKLPIFAEA